MRRERIVYTRHNGGVSILCPAAEAMAAMSIGGYWDHMPRGYIDTQIDRQISAGILPWAAQRFAHALAFGGHTDAEALCVIRDRDSAHLGTAHELLDMDEIPHDRWFRDAWRRSHNGGPIYISMPEARRMQMERVKRAAKDIDLKLDLWRARIRRAETPEALKQVWPKGLRHV